MHRKRGFSQKKPFIRTY